MIIIFLDQPNCLATEQGNRHLTSSTSVNRAPRAYLKNDKYLNDDTDRLRITLCLGR
jgi:hypothetical protein